MKSCEDEDKIGSGETKLSDAILYGGMGYGKVCIPKNLTDFIIMITYPPAYIFLVQKSQGFDNIKDIVISFVLTSLFYFPGLIHALRIKYNMGCGNVFQLIGESAKKK